MKEMKGRKGDWENGRTGDEENQLVNSTISHCINLRNKIDCA